MSVNSWNIIELECRTNYCNPPSIILWYIGNKTVSDHVNVTIDINNFGLSKTTSVLQYTVLPSDNNEPLYCVATNIEGYSVESIKVMLDVRCKGFRILLLVYFTFFLYKEFKTIVFLIRLI